MPSTYRHTQIGGVPLTGFAIAFAVFAWIAFRSGWSMLWLIGMAILVSCAFLFYSLTVEINDGELKCYFGPGLIRRYFALEDIVDAHPVRNAWYYGWGIRLTPGGWMFNISGLDAVELKRASGKSFRIGTDQPKELTEALRQAIA